MREGTRQNPGRVALQAGQTGSTVTLRLDCTGFRSREEARVAGRAEEREREGRNST